MKVKCIDCAFWSYSKDTLKRGSMFSLHFNYEPVGLCMSDDCGEATSGYTGTTGHKMSRRGEIYRYCKFFEPKEGEK